MLQLGRVRGRHLEPPFKHSNFCGLMSMDSMGCFHACNRFVQRRYFEPEVLWQTCRGEHRSLLVAEWPDVHAVYASVPGFSVESSFCCYQEVSRVKGRRRFETTATNAGEHSLHMEGFILNEQGKLVRHDEGDFVR